MVNKILFIGVCSFMLMAVSCGNRGKSHLGGRNVKESMVTDNVENDSLGHVTEIETKSNRPIYSQLKKELDSIEIYNDSIIYGFWFQPHAALEVNLFLHKNGRFELKKCDVTKKGTFKIDGYMVKLIADDGWGNEQFDGRVFHKHNRTNFYLTDSNENYLYLVKGSD